MVVQRLSALAGVTAASRLEVRPAPERVSSGIREIDELTGGLPRGCLTEICGAASSGRTSLLLSVLAEATRRQEVCALVDTTDAFDPASAAAAGVDFEKLLWVRCGTKTNSPHRHRGTEKNRAEGPVEQALRVTYLLLQAGGFGLVVMDFSDVPHKMARRIPLASWFRFQRVVEGTSTVLFVMAETPLAATCASLLLNVQSSVVRRQSSAEEPTHTQILDGLRIEGELLRSRVERKPVRSVTAEFLTKAG
jgi:hypothetical protein